MRRPLVMVVVAFTCGIVLAQWVHLPLGLAVLVAMVLLVAAVSGYHRRWPLNTWLVLDCFLRGGSVLGNHGCSPRGLPLRACF